MTDGVTIRPYDAERDESSLWGLKRDFELELGAETGGDDKAAVYAEKLTPRYRDRWLAWVDRCVDDDPGCVVVCDPEVGVEAGRGEVDGDAAATGLVGYAFLLPESLSFVWDAAVLNEIYVAPTRRGTAVADELFGAVVEQAQTQDLPLDRLVLDVDAENDRAQAFYRRHGFEPWGEMVAREL
ncbi:N-acetyltransferase [Halobellus salinus]|uniref:N-acetyltransferase n=1 Tax=Halobellus salinus TaxID=931585 RepID=A0A830ESB2_9EURY|nr:GNAT family N-acetyltransferase [Halobellus salinus]GGJ12813.1 N-acetyltransferase [Halobellus salinus]SMP32261.1 Ribosomal protein S18 acetylase RimI [Halobellus salinus]